MKILVTPRSFASTSKEPLKILQQQNYQLNLNETGERYTEANLTPHMGSYIEKAIEKMGVQAA